MFEMDSRDASNDVHVVGIHHCPVCRFPTLKPWYHRPRSIALEQITVNHPDYETRKLEVIARLDEFKSNIPVIPPNVDLANVAYFSRCKLALELYEVLVERLYTAAREGLGFITINEPGLVKEIEKVVDILARRLFLRHNVYKVLVTRVECTIYLTQEAFSWRRQHENSHWIDPSPVSTTNNTSSIRGHSTNQPLNTLLTSILRSRASDNTNLISSDTLPDEPLIPNDDEPLPMEQPHSDTSE
jgi:hypothetical protein